MFIFLTLNRAQEGQFVLLRLSARSTYDTVALHSRVLYCSAEMSHVPPSRVSLDTGCQRCMG